MFLFLSNTSRTNILRSIMRERSIEGVPIQGCITIHWSKLTVNAPWSTVRESNIEGVAIRGGVTVQWSKLTVNTPPSTIRESNIEGVLGLFLGIVGLLSTILKEAVRRSVPFIPTTTW